MSEPLLPEPALVRPTRVGSPETTALVPSGPTTPPAGGAESIPQTILRGLARRWRMVAGIGLLAAVFAGGAVWFIVPSPQPTATAKLLVYAQNAPTIISGNQHPDQPLDRMTQLALVRSQLVLNAALNMKGVANLPAVKEQADPLDWLAKKLTAEFEGPEILRITLALEDPEQAKVIVNAVLDAFLQEIVNKSVSVRMDRIRKLDEMAITAEESLKRKRLDFRNLSQDFGGADDRSLAHQQFLATQQLATSQTELIKYQSELRKLLQEEVVLKGRLTGSVGDVPDAVLEKYVDDDPRIQAAAQQVKDAEANLAVLRERVPDINKIEAGPRTLKAVEDCKQDYQKLRAKVREDAKQLFRQASSAELTARLTAVKQQIEFHQALEKSLETDVAKFQAVLKSMRSTALDLDPHKMDVKQGEELVNKIRAASTALKVEQDAPSRVRELERAVVARVDPEKRRLMMSAGAALGALLAVIGIVGFVEFRLRRVDSPDAVTSGLGLRVVGTVPKRPIRWNPWSGGGDEFERWAAESISCTRTMLMHANGLATHRVIQVTSPVSGEGKTTLSCQLAASVAGAGRKTLLVDGDLRNPSAHLRFDMPNGPGLCEVLRGEMSIHDVVKETHVPGLMLVPAGQWKDETAVALVSTELQGLFDVWRSQYDFVIVDSSPVLPVTDPLLFALHADGVLVALMQGVSRMPLANEAYKRMTALGIRVLGAVVNGTAVRGYGYSAAYFPKS